MSAQTSYSINQGVALAGLIFALHPSEIDSFIVETAAGIGFGVAVGRGTDDRQCVIGTANFLGISVRSLEREGVANTGAIEYSETEAAGVLRKGYIWAVCPTGCSPGDSVLYTTATGVLDSGTAAAGETQVDGATWESTAAAGGLAIIRLETTSTTAGA